MTKNENDVTFEAANSHRAYRCGFVEDGDVLFAIILLFERQIALTHFLPTAVSMENRYLI